MRCGSAHRRRREATSKSSQAQPSQLDPAEAPVAVSKAARLMTLHGLMSIFGKLDLAQRKSSLLDTAQAKRKLFANAGSHLEAIRSHRMAQHPL